MEDTRQGGDLLSWVLQAGEAAPPTSWSVTAPSPGPCPPCGGTKLPLFHHLRQVLRECSSARGLPSQLTSCPAAGWRAQPSAHPGGRLDSAGVSYLSVSNHGGRMGCQGQDFLKEGAGLGTTGAFLEASLLPPGSAG